MTYLVEGEIQHRNSLGTDIVIRPGAVNWMRAGKGIVHSERTSTELRESGQRLLGLQTWVALPQSLVESDPQFIHHGAEALPVVDESGVVCRVVAGEAFGMQSSSRTATETLYLDVHLRTGKSISLAHIYDERAIYLVSGEITVSGARFEPRQLLILRAKEQQTVVAASDARFIVFGGPTMDGPRYIWWNFVSSRLERIEQAKSDWSQGRFDSVPGDAAEFIPPPAEASKLRVIQTRSLSANSG